MQAADGSRIWTSCQPPAARRDEDADGLVRHRWNVSTKISTASAVTQRARGSPRRRPSVAARAQPWNSVSPVQEKLWSYRDLLAVVPPHTGIA
jgi:hypothetical protein